MKSYFLLFVLCLFSIGIHAQYHVATNGNDNNSGTSAAPWKTIQHALDQVNGGTINVHNGTYFEDLEFNNSGTQSNPIILSAFENEEVIINGANTDAYALAELIDVEHITLEGLHFTNHIQRDAVGILIEGRSGNITIRNCKVSNIGFSSNPNANVTNNTNAQGIIVYGTENNHVTENIQIIGCEVYDCVLGYSEALAINGNVSNFLIEGNIVHDVTNIGIDIIGHEETASNQGVDQARNGIIRNNHVYNCKSPYASCAGIYVDGGKDLIIERNIVHDNQWGIEVGCENKGKSTSNVIVRNNTIYHNDLAGIAVGGYDYPGGSGKVTDVSIINNTLHDNDLKNDYTGELYLFYFENLVMVNNILNATNSEHYILTSEDLNATSKNLTFKNNYCGSNGDFYFYYDGEDYESLSEFESGVSGATGNLKGQLIFQSGGTFDWNLKEGSNLIDKGILLDNTIHGIADINGHERIFGGAIDVGAAEYGSITSSIETFKESNLKVYPNPSNGVFNIDPIEEIRSIQIFNIVGALIYNSNEPERSICIEKSGTYILKVLGKNGESKTRRLIVQR